MGKHMKKDLDRFTSFHSSNVVGGSNGNIDNNGNDCDGIDGFDCDSYE